MEKAGRISDYIEVQVIANVLALELQNVVNPAALFGGFDAISLKGLIA